MRTPKTLPEGLPEVKACPMCYAEGRDPYMLDVMTHFYVKKAARYKGGYRISAYCREHENKKRVANLTERRQKLIAVERATGVAPPALAKMRRRAPARTLTDEERARRREIARAWREANSDRVRSLTEAWAADHKDEIRERKRRWYARNRKSVLEKQRQRRIEMGLGVRKPPKGSAPKDDTAGEGEP